MTSGSAGWIQYWPRAMSWAGRPKLIACTTGWISDDAGTVYAYARNIASGHGPVLHAGSERVEGYSSPA